MPSKLWMAATVLAAGIVATACTSSPGATATPLATSAPAATAGATPTTEATATAPASAPAGTATVEAKSVGTIGTVLVAGSNGMTVYQFAKDVKDSGTSACTGGCLTKWPALTVAAGVTPTAGAGVMGTLGTIIRADDGTYQVTYKGLPLYFFSGDSAPGDSNGVYTDWLAVNP